MPVEIHPGSLEEPRAPAFPVPDNRRIMLLLHRVYWKDWFYHLPIVLIGWLLEVLAYKIVGIVKPADLE